MKTKANPTFRKSALMLGAAASAMLIVSCGSSAPTPTPTPTATGTATPTPTPTDAADINFGNDFAFASGRLYIYAFFTPDGGVEVFSDASRLSAGTGGLSFTASPEAAIFGFSDIDAVTFEEATLTSASDTLRTYVNGEEQLTLELPFGNVLRATYQRNDSHISNTVPGMLRSRRVVILIDAVTTEEDITSDLSYTGSPEVNGGTPGTTTPGIVTAPDRTFTVDATNSTLTGTIQVFEDVGGTPTLVAELDVDTPVGTNGTFATELTDAVGSFTGALAGTLAGANREEIIFTFSASHTDGRKYVGSFIGTQPTPP